MNNEYLKSFLSENEVKAVTQFNGSEVMREAVKKILLGGLYANGVLRPDVPADSTRNTAFWLVSQGKFPAEDIGKDIQVLYEAIKIVENAFNDIGKFITPEKVAKSSNPAK